VLLVSQEMPPETAWGGIGTYADVLSEALVAKGHQVDVLSLVEGQQRSTARRNGVTIHRFRLPRVHGPGRLAPETWRRLWLAFGAARLAGRLCVRPDVIECPEWNAEGLALAVAGRAPLVVRLHSAARQLFPHTGQGRSLRGLDGRWAAGLEETSARLAQVVVSTRGNLAEMSDVVGLDRDAVHAIPYPVRLPEPSLLRAEGPPTVTFVGRLESRKGPEVLLRAAPQVLAEVPETRFVFVGRDGTAPGAPSSAAWLRREAQRLGIAQAIEFPGQLGRAELAAELARSTVCAFPSRWESFGNVVAEASATGRPVVVSAIPPFHELVEDGVTGHVVATEGEREWAAALIAVLGDRDRSRAMGEAGAARVASISAPGRVASLALTAYDHAIERWGMGARAGRGHPGRRASGLVR
jgi:glycosyltransferase involved in cell wall biosynthesis